MPGTNIVAYILTAALLLVAVVNQLAASGRIRRNGFVGIRIPPTLASEVGWSAGHRAAAAPLWIGSVLTAVACVVAQFSVVGGIPCIVLFVLSLAGSVVAAWRGASRAIDSNSGGTK
ncbi:SdpI family protein [Subtercola lobariae]|uniref:SdpI family protein n=1 Tax=Subtercola lobariae TaxID=1588641 RepID=UPI00166B8B7A|nr:SdpI family protein [Subtercola lobariae]